MKKDAIIEDLAKHALEDGIGGVKAETLQAIMAQASRKIVIRKRCQRISWGISILAAASLTLLFFFGDVFSAKPPADGLSEVRDALNLLCAVDEINSNLTKLPPEEMLLAWQDAPCATLL